MTSATAQDADTDAEIDIEEVVVTGTRIRNPNISSPSPVSVIGAAEIRSRGTVRIEDLLNTLPQTVASQGRGDFGGDGTSTVDLRGLGADRTLVLIDGRRLPYGQSNNTAADLNQIPEDLIERVEILTGGASAVYGADAVAGVVNFILKRDFEGIIIDGQIGINQTGNKSARFQGILEDGGQPVPGSQLDGFEYKTSVTVGVNSGDGKGNITAYFTYREANEIRQSDRIASACAFGGGDPEFFCLGSSTTTPARLTDFGLAANGFDLLAFDPGTGVTRDFVGGGSPNDTFNFASTQRTRAPGERFTIGALTHYDLTDNIELYMDLAYSDTTSQGQIGPSGTFFATDSINCDNPFLTAIQLDSICTQNGLSGSDIATVFIGRRNVEGGPRQFDNSNQTLRITGGLRGDINDTWSYDLNGQFARVTNVQASLNDLVEERLQRAFFVVNDADGNPVCTAAISVDGLPAVDAGCVPYNVFQPGGITQEALDYISVPAFQSGSVRQEIVSATFVGDLGEKGVSSPWAETGVQFVGGFEYRNDALRRQADDLLSRGQIVGSGTVIPVDESVNVYEFFGELAVPIIEDAEFAQELSATLAYRYSDYSTTGTQSTYAFGLNWQPVSDVRIRAQYARATRAPNIFELFLTRNVDGLFDLSDPDGDGVFDPCGGATPSATAAQCANTGVTAAQFGNVPDNPAGQFNQTTGGNPNLNVESTDTYTIGAIFTPSAIPGLTVSVDYFNITVNDFIDAIPPQLTLTNCLETGDDFFCSLITRDAGGSLFVDADTSSIIATQVNTGSIETSGIDINANYNFELGNGFGEVSLRYIGTYLIKYSTISLPGEDAFECAGFYSSNCIIPRAKYNHSAAATWLTESEVDVTLAWRRIGSVRQFGTAANSTNRSSLLRTINYFDVSANVVLAEDITLRVGINNVFDVLPPTSSALPAGLGTGNTFPAVYDTNGRFAFLGVSVQF
ncbi:MAG: TonB-dependent receptor [Kordiimonadaceae bacterium]|nr:TonB-dependent receptor [Kordiimonadaceae bacterium]